MAHNHLITEYWLNNQFGGKYRWTTLRHNGVMFPPEYKPHKLPVIYEGENVYLDKDAEEAATLYAKYIDTEYVKNRTFNKNFWKDWKKILGPNTVIKSLEGCDFGLIVKHILTEKENKKQLTKEQKEALKAQKDKEEKEYKTAIVDGKEQPVGNFRIEPPGLFIGRGCHPKMGAIKKRIYAQDVTINIDKDAPVPEAPPGHQWKEIVHDRRVEWLASWDDPITGKLKYVWLGTESKFKAESDIAKFNLARKLKRKIKSIREANERNLVSGDEYKRQIATALYFIDNLALRVGNEKGEDEADTVGVTSLRVEHIKLLEKYKIALDFLGKDSIRYVRTIVTDEVIYNSLKDFMKGKADDDELFDKITSADINKYLQSFMPNLTAKVFRTFNASYLFQKELNKITKKYDTYDEANKINILFDEFNKANAKVALLCNHQKKVSASFNTQIDKINQQIKAAQKRLRKIKKIAKNKERIDKAKKRIKELKAKRDLKIELKGVSLETSKTNYIDPRITVAFMKKHNIPVDKVFSKTLQNKFFWAFGVDKEFKF